MDEPKHVELPKETMYKFRGMYFSCNGKGHMKRDCTNKSFNHVKDFYCHGMGHNAIDCRKPKYDNDRRNSRMSRNTNPIDRTRSNERTSREGRSYEDRRQIMCYKCNNFGNINQNFHAPNDQQNPRSRTPVC